MTVEGIPAPYIVAQLDGLIVSRTPDSEQATRVLAEDPRSRCVIRDGVVLRWGHEIPRHDRASAEAFMRRAGLLTTPSATSAAQMRERVVAAQTSHRQSVGSTDNSAQHERDAGTGPRSTEAKPSLKSSRAPASRPTASGHRRLSATHALADPAAPVSGRDRPIEEDPVTECKTDGCSNPAITPRGNTPAWRVGYCRKCIDKLRHRMERAGTVPAKPAAKPAAKKPATKPAAKPATKPAAKPAAKPSTPKISTASPPPSALDALDHARACVALVDQLGGIERAQRIVEALAT